MNFRVSGDEGGAKNVERERERKLGITRHPRAARISELIRSIETVSLNKMRYPRDLRADASRFLTRVSAFKTRL